MARIPFVDTHFHLHDMKQPELRYAWLEPDAVHGFLGNIDAIKAQHYWIEDYIAEIRFANVPKAIHVQAALGIKDPVDETRLAAGLRRQDRLSRTASSRNAIWRSPMPAAVLERHMQFANVRGIRDFGPGDYLIDPAWQAGYKLLARHNLVSCLDTRVANFPQILALTAKAPDVVHLRRPLRHPESSATKEYFEAWQSRHPRARPGRRTSG